MPLPEVVMTDSFSGATGVPRRVRTPGRSAGRVRLDPSSPSQRGGARAFLGLGLAWLIASATVAVQQLRAGLEHDGAVARTSGVPFSTP